MNVLSKPTLDRFIEEFPEAREELLRWYTTCKKNTFTSFADVRATFPKVSWVGPDYLIFDIRGGHFRLITTVSFQFKVIRIKEFMRHSDYNHWRP